VRWARGFGRWRMFGVGVDEAPMFVELSERLGSSDLSQRSTQKRNTNVSRRLSHCNTAFRVIELATSSSSLG